jgi:hypothetical protein
MVSRLLLIASARARRSRLRRAQLAERIPPGHYGMPAGLLASERRLLRSSRPLAYKVRILSWNPENGIPTGNLYFSNYRVDTRAKF